MAGNNAYLPPANKVWGKLIFSEACVKNSVHGGFLVWGRLVPGGACSWGFWSGGSGPRGCLLWGVWSGGRCLLLGGAWCRPPRWLLLQAVRILLECIFVFFIFVLNIGHQYWSYLEHCRASFLAETDLGQLGFSGLSDLTHITHIKLFFRKFYNLYFTGEVSLRWQTFVRIYVLQ